MSNTKMTMTFPDIEVERQWKHYSVDGSRANDFMIVDDPFTTTAFIKDWDIALKEKKVTFYSETNYLNFSNFAYWTGWALKVKKCDSIGGSAVAKPLYYASKDNAKKMGTKRKAIGQMMSFLEACSDARSDTVEVVFALQLKFSSDEKGIYTRTITNIDFEAGQVFSGTIDMYEHISPSDESGVAAYPIILTNSELKEEKCMDPDLKRPTGWTRVAKYYIDDNDAESLQILETMFNNMNMTMVFLDAEPKEDVWECLTYENVGDLLNEEAEAMTFTFDPLNVDLSYFTDACFATETTADLSGFDFDDDEDAYKRMMEDVNEAAAEEAAESVASKVITKVANLVTSQTNQEIPGTDITMVKKAKGAKKRTLNKPDKKGGK